MRLLPAVLCLAALPAAAEPGVPDAANPVRALVLGHALFHQGQATRDGLAQIAGARIVAGVVVQIVERDSKIEGKASKEAAAARAPLDGTQMMTEAAAAVQADETLAYLLTVSETTTAVLPKATVKATAAQLAAGQSQTFRLAADGGARLDLGVIGAGSGGLAQAACVPANRLLVIPDQMSFSDAAAFQIAYGTAHLALEHKARLTSGETLLVTGAAGGVGLTAVEIGKRMGARVIASARGAEKLAAARAAGADHLIDSDTADLKAALRALGGVDVVFDPVGGPAFDAALRATNPEGRLLSIGFASGIVPQIPANLLLVKNLSVMGLYWGGYMAFRPEILTNSMATLFGWYAEGGLRPHISHVLPFDQLPQGLELLRSRASTGKVVITMP